MTPEIITIKQLQKWGACSPAIKWARKNYPDGVPFSAAAEVSEDWLSWLVAYVPSHRDRACDALLARPGGVSEDSLSYIVAYAPSHRDRANAILAERKRK